MHYPTDIRMLRPHERGVWELKTVDVRIFGWVPMQNYLILHCGGDAEHLHEDLTRYKPYIDNTVAFRESLTQTFPPPVMSREISDVLSNRR
jgi:hypothetical protein